MMGISSLELLVIVVVALIVVGPDKLPGAIRTLGRTLRAIRQTTRQFQTQVDQFVRESELDEIRRDVEATVRGEEKPTSGRALPSQSGGKKQADRRPPATPVAAVDLSTDRQPPVPGGGTAGDDPPVPRDAPR